LKEHHVRLSAADLYRKNGISDATFYKWLAKYGGMDVSDAKKLKALVDENSKSAMDNATPKGMLTKNF
jgi:putative transposase